jgi:hypothetical protein
VRLGFLKTRQELSRKDVIQEVEAKQVRNCLFGSCRAMRWSPPAVVPIRRGEQLVRRSVRTKEKKVQNPNNL